MFTEIIELLLQKKAGLDATKELEMQAALEAIEQKYAEQSAKIDGMLDMAGYVEPVVEPVVEAEQTVEASEADDKEVSEADDKEVTAENNNASSGFYAL